jgi:transposase
VNFGFSVRGAADLLQIKFESAKKIIHKYKKFHLVEKKKQGGPRVKFNQQQRDFIVQQQENNNELTYKQIQAAFVTKFNNNISVAMIASIIKAAGITTKFLVKLPAAMNAPATIQQRRAYSLEMIRMDTDNLIFIDESPFSLSMRRSRGRSKKGQRATITVKKIRTPSLSVLAAMQADRGLLYYETSYATNDAERFNQFISNLLKLQVFRTKSHVLIMDNSPIHSPDSLRSMIEGQHIHHSLKFLPPYSPQLNPIELVFSCWKAEVKKLESRGDIQETNLLKFIEDGSRSVKNEEKAKGWYHHVMRYYVLCAAGQPLDDNYNCNTLAQSI